MFVPAEYRAESCHLHHPPRQQRPYLLHLDQDNLWTGTFSCTSILLSKSAEYRCLHHLQYFVPRKQRLDITFWPSLFLIWSIPQCQQMTNCLSQFWLGDSEQSKMYGAVNKVDELKNMRDRSVHKYATWIKLFHLREDYKLKRFW